MKMTAPAQGGSSGGGLPSGWTFNQKGASAVSAGTTVTLATIGSVQQNEAYLAFASPDVTTNSIHLYQGSTSAAPPVGHVTYDMVVSGTDVLLKARSNAAGDVNVSWVIYKVLTS